MALIDRIAERRALSPATLFRTGLDSYVGLNDAGVIVNADTALNYSGFWACVRLLASDISTLPLDALRKDPRGFNVPLEPAPTWIDRPDPEDPSITRIDHFAQVAISLLLDGNAFTLVTPSVFDPMKLEVLNPRRVEVRKTKGVPEYIIRDEHGRPTDYVLTPANIIHISINRRPGQLRGMSPVEANQGSIGVALAAQKYIERFFGSGLQTPGFVTMPADATQLQADQVAAALQKRHGGWRKAHVPSVLTGGATWASSGITPRDAEMTAIFKQQLEEASRIFGIPPVMVGSQEPAGVAYASAVERAQHYIDHCLRHYVVPIEEGYGRLVPGDNRLAIPGSNTELRFNFGGLLRGDMKSRFEAYGTGLEKKFMRIDDVRRLEDWEPFGNDGGGLLQTPNNNAPDPRYNEAVELVKAGFDPASVLAALKLPDIEHTGFLPKSVQPTPAPDAAPII